MKKIDFSQVGMGIKFTQRDMMILNFMSIYGYCDLEAAYMLTQGYFPCSKRIFLRRLNALKKAGYIDLKYYNVPGINKIGGEFRFTNLVSTDLTFMHLGKRKPNIKMFKSNFFHEFFIIRSLAKCMQSGDKAYSEKMLEYGFNNAEIRPDIYITEGRVGLEIEISIKRKVTEYGKKFLSLQKQIDEARWAKKEPDIEKLIYLVLDAQDKITLMKMFESLKLKTIDIENNIKGTIVSETINNRILILTFDEFFNKKLAELIG